MNSYLTFKVKDEVFAISVSNVMEIREYEEPKPVPQKVEFVSGVIEFRDEVVPLINTGQKFNLGAVEVNQNSVIVILDLNKEDADDSFRAAILVDAVSDVIELEEKEIKPIRQEYRPDFVLGSYNYGNTFILMLNPDEVFSRNEIIEMDKILSVVKK